MYLYNIKQIKIMCLTVNKTKTKTKFEDFTSIAKRNITVYKVFYVLGCGEEYVNLSSPYKAYAYYLGNKYESDFSFTNHPSTLRIEKGLHSFKNVKSVSSRFIIGKYSNYVVIKCIIPKGATYIKGLGGEIVSNQLILPNSFVFKGHEYNINY